MTPTFVSYASSQLAAGVVSKPAGVIAGHVLVAWSASSGAPTTPSGWTLQKSDNYGGSIYLACYTKVAGGSEPSTYTFASASTTFETIIESWSGADTVSVITGTPTSISAASTNPATLPSLTTVGANAVLVMGAFLYAFGGDGTGLAISGGGTERREENYANAYLLAAHDELRASAGASGTRSITAAGALAGGYLIIGIMIALKNGQVNVNIAGEVAAISVAGINGSISAQKNVNVAGQVAAIALAGINGAASAVKNVSISGQVAAIGVAGIDGSISVTRNISIAGEVAAIAIAGLDGSISAIRNINIAGEVAAINVAGLNGSISAVKNVSISGQVAAIGVAGIDGAISVTRNISIAGQVAAIAIAGLDGEISAEVRDVVAFLLRESPPEPLILSRVAIEKDMLLARESVAGSVILDRAAIDKDMLLSRVPGDEPILMISADGDEFAS